MSKSMIYYERDPHPDPNKLEGPVAFNDLHTGDVFSLVFKMDDSTTSRLYMPVIIETKRSRSHGLQEAEISFLDEDHQPVRQRPLWFNKNHTVNSHVSGLQRERVDSRTRRILGVHFNHYDEDRYADLYAARMAIEELIDTSAINL